MLRILLGGLDWLVVAAGACLGIFTMSFFGLMRSPRGELWSFWLAYLGVATWALLLLLASLLCLRSRRSAALVYFSSSTLCGSAFVVLAIHFRKEPGTLSELALILLTVVGPPLVMALYWWFTHRFGRPTVLSSCPRSVAGRVICGMLVASALFVLVLCNVLLIASMRPGFSVNCRKADPFAAPRHPNHVVFTAQIVATCCVATARVFPRFGGFAVAKVQRRYWGLPWWNPGIVFLTQDIWDTREPLFVDGGIRQGALSHVFSIIEISICDRTNYLRNAQVDLRVLGDGPPKNGVRVIGRVERRVLQGQRYKTHDLAGEAVSITGPSGTVTAVTDAEGIYDVSGLLPGDYEIRYIAPYGPTEHSDGDYSCHRTASATGVVTGCTFYLW